MKPCKHGNHPFSFCQECCKEMNVEHDKSQRNDVLDEAIEAYNNYMIHGEEVKTHYGAIKAIEKLKG